MSFRRKPPAGNVRLIASISNNSRHVVVSKAGETIQAESWSERGFLLRLDRDRTVEKYRSQPIRFSFADDTGKGHTYVPDYMVWRTNGKVEIHEITRSERRDDFDPPIREKAARKICAERQWQYKVHTEQTLPTETEVTNLLWLYAYRPKVYFRPQVAELVPRHLENGKRVLLRALINDLAELLQRPYSEISGALCHLLWHGVLDSDLQQLMFLDGLPMQRALVWLAKENA